MSGALDVMLAEYADLRGEIHQRVNNQLLVLGGNVVLVAAMVPAWDHLVRGQPFTFLATPLLFGVVAWLYFEQDVFLTQAATYLHRELRGSIALALIASGEHRPDRVLQWERFRGDALFSHVRERRLLAFTMLFRYVATLGPGIGGFGLGVTRLMWTELATQGRVLAIALMAADVIVILGLAFVMRLVLTLYREISQ